MMKKFHLGLLWLVLITLCMTQAATTLSLTQRVQKLDQDTARTFLFQDQILIRHMELLHEIEDWHDSVESRLPRHGQSDGLTVD